MLKFELNKSALSERLAYKAALALFCFSALSLNFACGKRKPPLPPIERVEQRVKLTGFQRGSQVRLSWTTPLRNAPDGSVLNVSRADIYRLAEPRASARTLSEAEFASASSLIASIPFSDSDFGGKAVNYIDNLDFAGQDIRLRYAVRYVNASGSKAAFSNVFLIEPTAKIANPPSLAPVAVEETSLRLTWQAPAANADGSRPPNVLGYNVYRAASGETTAKLLNSAPVTEEIYADEKFAFDESYRYFVRTVSSGTEGEPVESGESNIIEISPKDVFPPAPPASITIAAAPTSISIFFAPNAERDLAGYRVYRSENQTEWRELTPDLIKTATFQDLKVESGKTYYYYLTAVDVFGNASEKSEIVKETVP